ncbi:membrane protein [Intrasporangium oryzae NRRL B-24470]|uniref:Membrane protein n=1 Tax=Intrasporangium oryzae NRRL B-24470 TaxID=1386089 RepID=W9GAW9_9MICO|nr:hypothetical protein [Intrasporangium oryzae]EWT03210.1 membrane protein [Intrasporangium oryzae NRRL B-24470]
MSQVTATARPLRSPRRGPAVTPLRVIPTRIAHTGNGAFVAICVVLLTVGLIALLLLNTALAQGSLTLGQLQRESSTLRDTAANLQEEIDRASASGALARRASELGMVRANQRAYIDLAKGSVTGTPEPATRGQAFPIVTSPTPPAVTRQVKSILASGTKAAAAATPAATPTPTATSTAPSTPGATPTSSGATPGGSPAPKLDTKPATPQGGQTNAPKPASR